MNKCSALTVEVSFWHWERRSAATSAFEQTQIANQCEAALSTVQYPLNDNRSIRNSACSAIPSLTSKSSKLWKTAYCGLEVLTSRCSNIHIIDDTHERRSVNNQHVVSARGSFLQICITQVVKNQNRSSMLNCLLFATVSWEHWDVSQQGECLILTSYCR